MENLLITFFDCNLKLIKSHKTKNILCCVGQRTILILQIIENKFITKQRFVDENEDEFYTCCEFLDLNDEIFIIFGGVLGILKILNVKTGIFYSFIDAHTILKDVKVYNDLIISCGDDKVIKIWDFKTLKCLNTLVGHEEVVLTLDIFKNFLISSGMDQKILIWDLKNIVPYKPICTIKNIHKKRITRCLFYGKLVVTLSIDGLISICKPNIEKYNKTHFKENPFFVISTIKYNNIIDFTINQHSLICFSQFKGLFKINLLDIINLPVKEYEIVNPIIKCLSLTSNSKNIFVLYENNIIEGYKIDF